ncbi:hypothetical protein [Paenibacillus donghaensis]|uniref:Uncharacterized protein n=1 Tax=Paenibacillus donghaensis TaxID=414771 RepID=A0A2Z2KDS1_9BACL|nr:hypothetical protein [Paenibacillus donghaensis]ASA24154.1 hypothetical protein B9T62_27325 [Paenibacillus donghaensis]
MERDSKYLLDYGHDGKDQAWKPFCSTRCRFFACCTGRGGFCASVERRELLTEAQLVKDVRILESAEAYSTESSAAKTLPGASSALLFWKFPGGLGHVQPWRRRLWELKK